MAQTTIARTAKMSNKAWSSGLFIDINRKSYWDRKFIAASDNAIIQRLTDLERSPGDNISFDLVVQLRGKPTTGDNRLAGKEEALRFYSDEVNIDQTRHAVSLAGRMSRKRVIHNLRIIGKDRLSDYWAKYFDELRFIYIAGARGINEDFIEDTTFVGHAANTISAPDAGHLLYGGDATSKATIDKTDVMTADVIRKAATYATMIQAVNPDLANMVPVQVGGEEHFICVMSPWQSYDLKQDTGATGWLEITKAAAGAEGRASPLFRGTLGMIDNVVLHEHQKVIRFSDYGADGTVRAARAMLMGRQAGVEAYGTSEGMSSQGRMFWEEDLLDYGNEPTIAAGAILGVKKASFNGYDFGVLAIDTAAKQPGT